MLIIYSFTKAVTCESKMPVAQYLVAACMS